MAFTLSVLANSGVAISFPFRACSRVIVAEGVAQREEVWALLNSGGRARSDAGVLVLA